LSQQIAADNARWEAQMREANRLAATNRYQQKIDEYANAFLRFADDTGVIPEDNSEWSLLKFDTGITGWDGPYVEGPIPPIDPWENPLKYVKQESRTGRVYGWVYSFGEDQRDQNANPSFDLPSMVRYFDLERFEDDPAVNPPSPQ